MFPEQDCIRSKLGVEYMGLTSRAGDDNCIAWKNYPTNFTFPVSSDVNNSHCRNPSNKKFDHPHCIVKDNAYVTVRQCSIPYCGMASFYNYQLYIGHE